MGSRRQFLKAALSLAVAPPARSAGAPQVIRAASALPKMPSGVMSGDVSLEGAVIWSRTDRPARMFIEYATNDRFENSFGVRGPVALEDSDFTAQVTLTELPWGQRIFYRVLFEDIGDPMFSSPPMAGSFQTPTWGSTRDVSFSFSGDEAGQGWGISEDFGGYKIYETMRQLAPDLFLHLGDQIYADGPLADSVRLPDGRIWNNHVTEAKRQVAQSLDQFRGNFAYNHLDENRRGFAAEVPFVVQWDDHETRNNWYPGQIIDDPRYHQERRSSVLAAYANRAMFEYNPIRLNPNVRDRLYRQINYGPLLEIFVLDQRSYRANNSENLQADGDSGEALLGGEQLRWLQGALANSLSTWKVIASDMPLSLVVSDNTEGMPHIEGLANGEHKSAKGRELEIAGLLTFIKDHNIENVIFVSADVHYASAVSYHPDRASIGAFKPFWEFIAGPLHAGSFGPNEIDRTFGPQVEFVQGPEYANQSPADGFQFFGFGNIDHKTKALTVSLINAAGESLYEKTLDPR
ncbi:MAG: alkaline phosphatase D family protein [Pseudomonadota bacterium]